MGYDVDLTVVVYDIPSADFQRIVEGFEEEFIQIGDDLDFFLQTRNLDYNEAVERFVKPFLALPDATVYFSYQTVDGEFEDHFGKKAAVKKLEDYKDELSTALAKIKMLTRDEKPDAESILRALDSQEASLNQILNDLKEKLNG